MNGLLQEGLTETKTRGNMFDYAKLVILLAIKNKKNVKMALSIVSWKKVRQVLKNTAQKRISVHKIRCTDVDILGFNRSELCGYEAALVYPYKSSLDII